eukprot:299244-Amphidinium_carterae.1
MSKVSNPHKCYHTPVRAADKALKLAADITPPSRLQLVGGRGGSQATAGKPRAGYVSSRPRALRIQNDLNLFA